MSKELTMIKVSKEARQALKEYAVSNGMTLMALIELLADKAKKGNL